MTPQICHDERIAGFDFRQVDDGYVVAGKFFLVWRLFRIDRSEPGDIAPDPSRNCQRAVILRNERE